MSNKIDIKTFEDLVVLYVEMRKNAFTSEVHLFEQKELLYFQYNKGNQYCFIKVGETVEISEAYADISMSGQKIDVKVEKTKESKSKKKK